MAEVVRALDAIVLELAAIALILIVRTWTALK